LNIDGTDYTPLVKTGAIVLVRTATIRTEKRLRKGMYTFEEYLTKAESGDTGDEMTDACWEGYEAVGTKKKGGKTVPNCVPKSKT